MAAILEPFLEKLGDSDGIAGALGVDAQPGRDDDVIEERADKEADRDPRWRSSPERKAAPGRPSISQPDMSEAPAESAATAGLSCRPPSK